MKHGEATVTLVDGRQVSNYSDDWKIECEARSVLLMPSKQMRRDYLFGQVDERGKIVSRGVMQYRGEAACSLIQDAIWRIWRSQNNNRNQGND